MSLKLIIYITFLVAIASAKPYRSFRIPLLETRIVGGNEARQGQYPWQVSLQWGWLSVSSHFCGGSILSDRWIITAGHCAKAVPSYGDFIVKAGKHDLKVVESTEQSIAVERTFVHNKYTGNVAPYDIALLKLEKPLKLGGAVQAINLPSIPSSTPTGNATLTGWGSMSRTDTPLMPNKLQTIDLPLINLNICKQAIEELTGPSPLHETNICTGPLTGGFSACNGDSGGPLAVNATGKAELIGIVSWGIFPCGTVGAPSVYTNISFFVTWIGNIMARN